MELYDIGIIFYDIQNVKHNYSFLMEVYPDALPDIDEMRSIVCARYGNIVGRIEELRIKLHEETHSV